MLSPYQKRCGLFALYLLFEILVRLTRIACCCDNLKCTLEFLESVKNAKRAVLPNGPF